jgi:two-component system, OmpR family, response regulator ChvI
MSIYGKTFLLSSNASRRCKISPSKVRSMTETRKIIMVDDEPDINLTIKKALEENGFFQVDTFNDAESALVKFKPEVYDLALLDIRMPGTSGFQLWRKLREMDKKLKICFLTATKSNYAGDIDSDVINDTGADCFLAKPVNTIDLMNRLNVLLSQE